jgi:pimeloyl-ACP methyl ester carboxylesterase
MQARGVEAGAEAARLIKRLFEEVPELDGARVHLLGHSFGGLVVSNIAHTLTKAVPISTWEHGKPEDDRVSTLCTIQGALASNWLEENPEVVDTVSTTIGAVYSRYDTANMFYYPLANRSRQAQGHVGFSGAPGYKVAPRDRCPRDCTGERNEQGDPLVDAKNGQARHIHRSRAYTTLADPPRIICHNERAIINVDASRLIYEGPPASGGGHADIYKDDVVHLLWGITHRTTVCEAGAAREQEAKTAEAQAAKLI